VPEAQGQLHCFVSARRTSCLNRTDASVLQRGRPAARRARRRTRRGRQAGAARLPAVLALRPRSSYALANEILWLARWTHLLLSVPVLPRRTRRHGTHVRIWS
jgi:hypothetical protein